MSPILRIVLIVRGSAAASLRSLPLPPWTPVVRDELQDSSPGVLAFLAVFGEGAVEERMGGALVDHDLVLHVGVVERPPERVHMSAADVLVGSPEEAEHRAR